jgi:hypothetical protein
MAATLKCPFAEVRMSVRTELQTLKNGMPVIILNVPIKHFAIIPSRIPERLSRTIFTDPVNFYSFFRMVIQ